MSVEVMRREDNADAEISSGIAPAVGGAARLLDGASRATAERTVEAKASAGVLGALAACDRPTVELTATAAAVNIVRAWLVKGLTSVCRACAGALAGCVPSFGVGAGAKTLVARLWATITRETRETMIWETSKFQLA